MSVYLPPTSPLLLHYPSILLHWCIKPSQDHGFLCHGCQIKSLKPFPSILILYWAHCGLPGNIGICICKDVAEHLRRYLYQSTVSKHFLTSTIVSGFGVCMWDGSPGRAVSGWPFLQSLLHSLCLDFL